MPPPDAGPGPARAQPVAGERPPARSSGYDPGIPTRDGYETSAGDLVRRLGTGASGPHDIGTRPGDVPRDPLRAMNDPESPQNRVWTRDRG